MSTIDELRAMREQYKAEGKTGGGGRDTLFFRAEDKAYGFMLWDGEQPQGHTFQYYLGHQYPAAAGQQWGPVKPCLQSLLGPNADCPGCKAGYKTKDRMAMWFYTYIVMHQKLKDGEQTQLQFANFQGSPGYMREVNESRIWETSAWRDSPFDDIMNMAEQLKANGRNLHSGMIQIYASKDGKDRRYKFYMLPGSEPLPAGSMQQLIAAAPSIKDWLVAQVTPLATAEQAAGAATYQMVDGKLVQVTAAPATTSGTPPPAPLPAIAAAPAAPAPTPPAPVAPPPIAIATPTPPTPPAPPIQPLQLAADIPAAVSTPVVEAPGMPDLPDDDELTAESIERAQAAGYPGADAVVAPQPVTVPGPAPVAVGAAVDHGAMPAVRPKGLF